MKPFQLLRTYQRRKSPMRHDIRRIFQLLIDAGADRENRSAYSGKTIRQHYEGTPMWELCGDLFDRL